MEAESSDVETKTLQHLARGGSRRVAACSRMKKKAMGYADSTDLDAPVTGDIYE